MPLRVCVILAVLTAAAGVGHAAEGFYVYGLAGPNFAARLETEAFDIEREFRFGQPVRDADIIGQTEEADLDPGFVLGGGVGHAWELFAPRLSVHAEGEFTRRGNDVDSVTVRAERVIDPDTGIAVTSPLELSDISNGTFDVLGFGVNGLVRFDVPGGVFVHGGAGLGVAVTTSGASNNAGFYAQPIVGVGYTFLDRLDLTLEYRFFFSPIEIESEVGGTDVEFRTTFRSNDVLLRAAIRF